MLVHASENFYGVVTQKAIDSIPGGVEKLAGFQTNTGGMAGDKAKSQYSAIGAKLFIEMV